jgi:hypothetical protein
MNARMGASWKASNAFGGGNTRTITATVAVVPSSLADGL